MENFYSWMMKPVNHDDVEVWFNVNNMIYEKRQLFSDFTFGLHHLIKSTYLGDDTDNKTETKLVLSQEEKISHFDWCWKKTLENFSKENVRFNLKGEHREYYEKFFMDLFYNAENKTISENIDAFFEELFDEEKMFTKSDLDMLTEIYKLLNKNIL
jgi:hypothetical protein